MDDFGGKTHYFLETSMLKKNGTSVDFFSM